MTDSPSTTSYRLLLFLLTPAAHSKAVDRVKVVSDTEGALHGAERSPHRRVSCRVTSPSVISRESTKQSHHAFDSGTGTWHLILGPGRPVLVARRPPRGNPGARPAENPTGDHLAGDYRSSRISKSPATHRRGYAHRDDHRHCRHLGGRLLKHDQTLPQQSTNDGSFERSYRPKRWSVLPTSSRMLVVSFSTRSKSFSDRASAAAGPAESARGAARSGGRPAVRSRHSLNTTLTICLHASTTGPAGGQDLTKVTSASAIKAGMRLAGMIASGLAATASPEESRLVQPTALLTDIVPPHSARWPDAPSALSALRTENSAPVPVRSHSSSRRRSPAPGNRVRANTPPTR